MIPQAFKKLVCIFFSLLLPVMQANAQNLSNSKAEPNLSTLKFIPEELIDLARIGAYQEALTTGVLTQVPQNMLSYISDNLNSLEGVIATIKNPQVRWEGVTTYAQVVERLKIEGHKHKTQKLVYQHMSQCDDYTSCSYLVMQLSRLAFMPNESMNILQTLKKRISEKEDTQSAKIILFRIKALELFYDFVSKTGLHLPSNNGRVPRLPVDTVKSFHNRISQLRADFSQIIPPDVDENTVEGMRTITEFYNNTVQRVESEVSVTSAKEPFKEVTETLVQDFAAATFESLVQTSGFLNSVELYLERVGRVDLDGWFSSLRQRMASGNLPHSTVYWTLHTFMETEKSLPYRAEWKSILQTDLMPHLNELEKQSANDIIASIDLTEREIKKFVLSLNLNEAHFEGRSLFIREKFLAQKFPLFHSLTYQRNEYYNTLSEYIESDNALNKEKPGYVKKIRDEKKGQFYFDLAEQWLKLGCYQYFGDVAEGKSFPAELKSRELNFSLTESDSSQRYSLQEACPVYTPRGPEQSVIKYMGPIREWAIKGPATKELIFTAVELILIPVGAASLAGIASGMVLRKLGFKTLKGIGPKLINALAGALTFSVAYRTSLALLYQETDFLYDSSRSVGDNIKAFSTELVWTTAVFAFLPFVSAGASRIEGGLLSRYKLTPPQKSTFLGKHDNMVSGIHTITHQGAQGIAFMSLPYMHIALGEFFVEDKQARSPLARTWEQWEQMPHGKNAAQSFLIALAFGISEKATLFLPYRGSHRLRQ